MNRPLNIEVAWCPRFRVAEGELTWDYRVIQDFRLVYGTPRPGKRRMPHLNVASFATLGWDSTVAQNSGTLGEWALPALGLVKIDFLLWTKRPRTARKEP